MRFSGQFLPERFQNLPDAVIIQLTQTGSGEHHHVQYWQICLPVPERFPDLALDPVSLYRLSHMALGDNQPDSGVVCGTRPGENQQMLVTGTIADLIKYLAVISWRQQSDRPWKAFIGRFSQAGSGAETLAALGTATGNHLLAAFGGHTGTKTVVALTLEDAGLKSTLHGVNPGIAVWSVAGSPATGKICPKIGTQF